MHALRAPLAARCLHARSLLQRSVLRAPMAERMRVETAHFHNLRFLSTAPAAHAPSTEDERMVLASLERSLDERQPQDALSFFSRLKTPPAQLLSQKLAMLLAKHGDAAQTQRAVEILLAVYMQPGLQPDDYTQLASIYVVDACLRHRREDSALEIHDEAFNLGVSLDLPAYDAMVRALVEADQLEDAAQVIKDVSNSGDVALTEHSYGPLLLALVERQDYDGATGMLRIGRHHGVAFTSETFYPLVEIADADEEASNSLVAFLTYVEQVWDEAKLMEELVEDEEQVTVHRTIVPDDDEDDDYQGNQ